MKSKSSPIPKYLLLADEANQKLFELARQAAKIGACRVLTDTLLPIMKEAHSLNMAADAFNVHAGHAFAQAELLITAFRKEQRENAKVSRKHIGTAKKKAR